ncbi:hypothetical protein OIU85_001945 [Salix viminalis]|nr:hypothetical protein OIU85_001945 [Salix viminalis]
MAKFESDGGTCDPSHGEDDQVKVDIDSLISSVGMMMSQKFDNVDKCFASLERPPFSEGMLFYTPNAFSIGPGTNPATHAMSGFETAADRERGTVPYYAELNSMSARLYRTYLTRDFDIGRKSKLLGRNFRLVKSSENDEEVKTEWEPIPSATDLVEAGIDLKVSDSEHRSILDVTFRNGSLEMHSLLIQETTEVIIRNLISYEQCSPQCTDIITSYAVLLDSLINTTKDMDILTRSGIINNWLNPEEATQFFNKLYHDAYLKKYYYHKLHQDVNKYYRRRCPRWHALLMRNYLGTPWAIVSIFAAATLLSLTVVQTIFTVMN